MGFKWVMFFIVNIMIYLFGFGAVLQLPDIPKSILTICLILGINLVVTMIITTYMTVYCITKRNYEVDDDDEETDLLTTFEEDLVTKLNNDIIQALSDAIDDGKTSTIWYNQFKKSYHLRCGNETLTSIASVQDLLRLFAESRTEECSSFEDM